MSFKSIGLTALTSAAVASVAMVPFSPAQAITLKGSIAVSGAATVQDQNVGETKNLDFTSVQVTSATGSFAGISSVDAINSLPLTLTSQVLDASSTPALTIFNRTFNAAGLTPFIDFGLRTIEGVTSNLFFNLDASSNFKGSKILAGSSRPLLTVSTFGPVTGQFVFDEETIGSGFLSGSRSGKAAKNGAYQFTLTARPEAVPTPALLPGLVGMGVAALRKRKSEVEETV